MLRSDVLQCKMSVATAGAWLECQITSEPRLRFRVEYRARFVILAKDSKPLVDGTTRVRLAMRGSRLCIIKLRKNCGNENPKP